MWMNDPNGMVYLDGEYHLFYQYYPDSTIWGPMHWGHAISRDLLHWEHMPIALYPDSIGLIFSGSAVYDKNNTSRLGSKENPPLVALFTYHNMAGEKAGSLDFQTQGLAYSIDKGRNWTKYKGNPIIKNPGIKDFRDPKVVWHEQAQSWIMALAAGDRIQFFSSPNLIDWEIASEFGQDKGCQGGVWECPDLFPTKLEGSDEERWVLIVSIGNGGPNGGSATQYFVGDFDGMAFTLDPEFVLDTVVWLDYGKDNYAGVTWSNAPDDKKLFIGWISNWQYAREVPTARWRSAMTLPRELTLVNTATGPRLQSRVVEVFSEICEKTTDTTLKDFSGAQVLNFSPPINQAKYELQLTWSGLEKSYEVIGLQFHNASGESLAIDYDPIDEELHIIRKHLALSDFSPLYNVIQKAPLKAHGKLDLIIYLDHSSIEVFTKNGDLVMTSLYFAESPLTECVLVCVGEYLDQAMIGQFAVERIWD
jgi:fructan beta-fructosidase